MRKLSIFSVVLSLFLLVPASITRAQVTKTLNGTVRYESGMSKSTFTTPNGDIVVNLPQSMAGAVITGTVSTQPAGSTEKEKSRNLKELMKMVVNLGGQKIPLSSSPSNFDWLTHMDRSVRTPMELLNVSGNKIAELSLPPVLSAPAPMGGWGSNAGPVLGTPSKVLVKGDMLNVYTSQQFTAGGKFVLTDSKGQNFTVKPVALSANQAVITVPPAAAMGTLSVREEGQNNANSAKVNLIDISLSSPNTNLRPGERSSVVAIVIITNDKGEWIHPDLDNWFGSLKVDLQNLTPNVVTMEGGNLQRVYIRSGTETTSDSFSFRIQRNITGNAVGSFSVSATLHEDFTTSNDPFRPQLNVLQTPEDFNAWANALKKDLGQYAPLMSRVWTFGDDGTPYAFNQHTQKVIDNMPVCTSPGQLDECKAVAYSLLQPLHVPKGAANTWSSAYETFKSALKPLNELPANNTTLPDWDIINNGLDLIERGSYRNNDRSMILDVNNARQLVNTINESGETKENLEKLNTVLHSLSTQMDKRIANNGNLWKLTDMLFSTYCFDKRTRDGIDPMKSMVGYLDPVRKILMASPEYQQKILNSLQAVPTGNGNYHIKTLSETMVPVSYDIRLMPFERTNTYDSEWWAERLIETVLKKDTSRGEITSTSKDSTGTYYVYYKNAKCEVNSYSKEETTSDCMQETEWDGKEQKSKPTGRYQKITCYKTGSCKKGNDFCTEAYLVSCITQIYMDAGCTKRLKTFDFKHFSCL